MNLFFGLFTFILGLTTIMPAMAAAVHQLPPGHPLTRTMVDQIIQDRLAAGDDQGRILVQVNTPQLPIENRARTPIQLTVLKLDASPKSFQLVLQASLASGHSTHLSIQGTLERQIRIPVSKYKLARNSVIHGSDLDWAWFSERHLDSSIVQDSRLLAGMETTRQLRPGSPIKAKDLRSPVLVSRGDHVTVFYQKGPVLLTALAKALESGAKAESILVANVDSKHRFRAVVSGVKEVTVMPEQGDRR